MKTILRTILSISLFLILLCGGIMFYTNRASGEVAGILDQLNPLVPKSEIYVKTQEPESVNSYGTAHYKQVAATADGQTRVVEFEGIQVLKTDRYLKLTNKGAHVETYEEIAKEEVPAAALKEIDK
jgi:uncharacterized protein (TIGR01655 family)